VDAAYEHARSLGEVAWTGCVPRGPAPPQFTGPASLLVHTQLAASVRIKSATLPNDAGEKNEPAGRVAESIGSLDDLIQLAEGLRLGVVHASSGGRECSPFCCDQHHSRVRLQCLGQRRQPCRSAIPCSEENHVAPP
jgi:hypothetical protein